MLTSELKHHQTISSRTNKRKYFIETYGCQMNVADTELVKAMLENLGFTQASDLDSANVIFINTCSIRDHAENKVNSHIGKVQINQRKKT